MSTFKVTNEVLNSQYNYNNNDVIVNGQYVTNTLSSKVQTISGQVYRKDASGNQGEYIGNFNGTMRDDKMKYSISEMERADADIVWDAIDDIESHVIKA